MTYYVYILYSQKADKFYYGQTQNLKERLEYHNSGRSKYTKTYTPWTLFASKHISSRSEAMLFEKKLKNLKSRDKMLAFIDKNDFTRYQLNDSPAVKRSSVPKNPNL